ncbi:aldo/keto reductase [Ruminococcus sp. OA3]|uniref:aldo/keto reductase n=1 Tax=Ruminococcus sp. OA3 TaxID=2914164 RepID=UPI001F063CFF|nr:aldo/keto reductase [Ruminococcus sp. OA3]MCH1982389.1 aldo/keto reductase [Ruminococcus sp. OA3]
MRYTKLGTTDMEVSQITIGTWAIGGAGWGDVDRQQSVDAIYRMVDHGVNFIDTAPAYNHGFAECVVGEVLPKIRDKVFVATKGGVTNIGGRTVRDSSGENLVIQCDESLKRLNADYIDLYMIHWPDYNVPFEETFTALERLKEQGKIRHIGVSNFSLTQIFEAEKYAKIDVAQVPYSMVNRSQERFMKWYHDHNIGIMSWGSLGGGILTGAFRTLPDFDKDDIRLSTYDSFHEPKFSKVMEILKVMDTVAKEHGVPVAQVTINWNLKKEFVDTSLVGVINTQQADENCACMDWELSDDEMISIDEKIDVFLGDQETYCRQRSNPWALGYRD